MTTLNVIIFSRGAGKQQYGLGQDAHIMEQCLREMMATGKTNLKISHADPYLFIGHGALPQISDVHIYLEVPCRVAFPWAKVNVVVPNAEWWYKDAWSWTKDAGAIFWFRTLHCQKLFDAAGIKGTYIGWRCPPGYSGNKQTAAVAQALYVVGGSKHKKMAADVIVKCWRDTWPRLVVLCAEQGPVDLPANVDWRCKYISNTDKRQLQESSLYHIVASTAEGFGYTMAEALNQNALILRTDLPVYEEFWGDVLGPAGCIKTKAVVVTDISGVNVEMMDMPRSFEENDVVNAMNELLRIGARKPDVLTTAIMKTNKNFRQHMANAWKTVSNRVKNDKFLAPPNKPAADLPVIGVVTLIHNRPQWFSHAVRNIETTSYPRDKIVWIVVDDSVFENRIDIQIERAKQGLAGLQIEYVSLAKKTPIGEKRNLACSKAIATRPDVSVFAMMDDDDHYSKSSLSIRVAWLGALNKECVYASTLPMYHINKYISAINVPPLNLAPCERVSEATLCFTRAFWQAKPFPKLISIAEGEDFLRGREQNSVEIPPEGVIVSFLHGKNFTSRRVPESNEPNGCHYGFTDEYFTMISQIASHGAA